MPYSSISVDINCAFEVLWSFLVDKAHSPEHYVSDLKACEVIDSSENRLTRILKAKDFDVLERVEFHLETGEIHSFILDHPRYRGSIVQRIQALTKPHPHLLFTMTLDWREKEDSSASFRQDPRFNRMLKKIVRQTKKLIESE